MWLIGVLFVLFTTALADEKIALSSTNPSARRWFSCSDLGGNTSCPSSEPLCLADFSDLGLTKMPDLAKLDCVAQILMLCSPPFLNPL